MNLTIRNAIYVAVGILITSAIVSQFQESKLIWTTLVTLSVIPILYFGYREAKKQKKCLPKKNRPLKVIAVTLGAALVFFAFGYKIGKLIYLWSEV